MMNEELERGMIVSHCNGRQYRKTRGNRTTTHTIKVAKYRGGKVTFRDELKHTYIIPILRFLRFAKGENLDIYAYDVNWERYTENIQLI